MNIYVVTEGNTEKKIYKHWIPLVNPNLSFVESVANIQSNQYLIVEGRGNPYYYSVIKNAITDVNNHGSINRLVICVDSENLSYAQKYLELTTYLSSFVCNIPIFIVIQHFCIETWALGNSRVFPRNPQDEIFKKYLDIYDVSQHDPELLPAYPEEELNRSQFAYRYLKKMLSEKGGGQNYSKTHPGSVMHHTYFNEINLRHDNSSHIKSFNDFLVAFT